MSLQRVIRGTIKSNTFVKPIHTPLIKSYGTDDKEEHNYDSTKKCECYPTKEHKLRDIDSIINIVLNVSIIGGVIYMIHEAEAEKLRKGRCREYWEEVLREEWEEKEREERRAKERMAK